MESKRYLITCKECGAKRQIGLVPGHADEIIDWLDNNPDAQATRIISGRKRLDGQWGWQCICGNDDLLTKQEKQGIKNASAPKPKELADIMNDLKVQPNKFEMVGV